MTRHCLSRCVAVRRDSVCRLRCDSVAATRLLRRRALCVVTEKKITYSIMVTRTRAREIALLKLKNEVDIIEAVGTKK